MNVGGGEVPAEVALLVEELSRAVELTHLPTVSHEQRIQAYNACENFKDHSPWCPQAGLILVNGQYSPVVKHFGLKLMEHTVQSRWPHLTQGEKIFIKENAMKLLYMGGWETGHLNNALARVIVEMIKREWPQHWPGLLVELNDACSRGHMQTEIVLHIFLRLTEDVATLQTLEQQQRRKDIYQALTSNMSEIFAFFMGLIEMHVGEFREKTSAGDYVGAASNGRVVQAVLRTLTEFVEWVSTNHIVMNNGYLLQILCVLLQDDVFQLPAAECLLQVVNRKGSTKEKKPLMMLFSDAALTCIRDATRSCINAIDEPHYLFLKKIAQVLVGLGQLLTSMWSHCAGAGAGAGGGMGMESWLPLVLESTLVLAAHPSLTLAHAATAVWLAVLKHEAAARHPHVLAALPQWLHAAAPKLLKVTYPSTHVSGTHSTLAYVCMDYDSEQEFAIFFNKFRTETLDSFRHCMLASPLVTWAYVEQWTNAALDKVERSGPGVESTDPLYIECEALAQALDVVLSRLVVAAPRPGVAGGLQLLRRCVDAAPPAPLLLSLLLSFLSALFVFLSCANSQLAGPGVGAAGAELLPRVLDKIFAALVYDEDRTARAVKNLRRHAAGLLVKLASKYPLLLLPVFPRLHELSRAVVAHGTASAVESVTLQEALLLVSNHFCSYWRQAELVKEVLAPCAAVWARLRPRLATGAALAALIGLDAELEEEACEERRALHHALALTLGVVKRCAVPADPERAARGGFAGGTTPAGNPVWRNPCAEYALPLLPAVLELGRALHQLHGEGRYARLLAPPAAERRNLVGGGTGAVMASECAVGAGGGAARPDERLQTYLHTLHENVCLCVGAAAGSLGRELYAAPRLAEVVAGSLLAAPRLPDHWLRPLVRNALRPLVLHCPAAHHRDVAVPLLAHVAPFMVAHLAQRWDYVAALYDAGKLDEELPPGSESQEVLDDILVRNLTREYLDLLKVSLMEGGATPEPSPGDMEEDGAGTGGGTGGRHADTVSELGAAVLGDARAGPAVLRCVLLALAWADSAGSLRACALALGAVRGALQAGQLGPAEAGAALAAALRALRVHGAHDANQAALLALGLQLYETLRAPFPHVAHVLRAIPDVDPHDLQRLEDKLVHNPHKPNKLDKSKRDLFKKVTSPLIGRDVGQLFKKEVYILNLPSMAAGTKPRPPSAVDAPGGANLDVLFATTHSDQIFEFRSA